jgi:hypothetical protein
MGKNLKNEEKKEQQKNPDWALHGGHAQQMEKDKRKQTESEGSAAADVEAEDQEEPPVADGEGTRRRTRRKGSDEDDNGEALGPRKRWRATTGEEKKSKYSAREDEALLASVQAFCSVRHNHNHFFFLFVLFLFLLLALTWSMLWPLPACRLQGWAQRRRRCTGS